MRARSGWCWAVLLGAGSVLAASAAGRAEPAAPAPAAAPAPPDTAAAAAADPFAPDPVLGHADRCRPTDRPDLVAFTFDDGPDPATTPAVLAALEHYDVPAAFFVVSRKLVGDENAADRTLLAREDHDGFVIGSHSWSHAHLRTAGHAVVEREVDDAVRTLALTLGRPIGLYRPPYGAIGRFAAAAIARRGLTDVLWNIDTQDWRTPDARVLRRRVLALILSHAGGIVLMHDTRRVTAEVLPEVLDDLEGANCARLARGDRPIVPVSIHYFLTDGAGPHHPGVARPVPAAVAARTAAYLAALPGRCARRPLVATAPHKAAPPGHHAARRRARRPPRARATRG